MTNDMPERIYLIDIPDWEEETIWTTDPSIYDDMALGNLTKTEYVRKYLADRLCEALEDLVVIIEGLSLTCPTSKARAALSAYKNTQEG